MGRTIEGLSVNKAKRIPILVLALCVPFFYLFIILPWALAHPVEIWREFKKEYLK